MPAKGNSQAEKKAKVRINNYKFADVQKHIKAVARDGESLKTKIHSVAVCILKHHMDNPDQAQASAKAMNDLVNVAGYHAKPLAKWIAEKTPYQFSDETGEFYAHIEQKVKPTAFVDARDTPFWEVSPPPEVKALSLKAEVNALVGRMQKRLESTASGKGKFHKDDDIPTDMLRKLISVTS